MSEPEKVDLNGELSDWFAVLVEAREQMKEWSEREKEAKAQLSRLLNARDADLQANGKTVLKAVNRPGVKRIDTARLKKELPDVATRFTTIGAGSYRLELVAEDAPSE